MTKFFRIFLLLPTGFLIVLMITGCGGCHEIEEEEAAPAALVRVVPPSGEIAANGSITVNFNNAPADVRVSTGVATAAGKTLTISGPFTPGPLTLMIAWANGVQVLDYTVTAPDHDPPVIIGDTLIDTAAETINNEGKIEITFNERVNGYIALHTENLDDVGWLGTVEGNKATLKMVKGKEIRSRTRYVIKGKVSDAAGNYNNFEVIFPRELDNSNNSDYEPILSRDEKRFFWATLNVEGTIIAPASEIAWATQFLIERNMSDSEFQIFTSKIKRYKSFAVKHPDKVDPPTWADGKF